MTATKAALTNYEDNTEFQFAFEVAFGNGQIFEGEPTAPPRTRLVYCTERTIFSQANLRDGPLVIPTHHLLGVVTAL
jgi:hypothetical protein